MKFFSKIRIVNTPSFEAILFFECQQDFKSKFWIEDREMLNYKQIKKWLAGIVVNQQFLSSVTVILFARAANW